MHCFNTDHTTNNDVLVSMIKPIGFNHDPHKYTKWKLTSTYFELSFN